jgi:hypothetical protein
MRKSRYTEEQIVSILCEADQGRSLQIKVDRKTGLGQDNQTWVGELPENNPAVQALNFIEENFSGVMPFYVVLSGSSDKLSSYEAAKAINAISQQLREHAQKPTIRSPLDAANFMLEHSNPPLNLAALDDDTFQELRALYHAFRGSGQPRLEKDSPKVRLGRVFKI